MTASELSPPASLIARLRAPGWNNWPAALVLFLLGMPLAIATLPPSVSFWISGALAVLLATTIVVNAWGRYTGGLLVTPALMLLFLMNVFPLLWSLGLSFFAYECQSREGPDLGRPGQLPKGADRSRRLGPACKIRSPW